MLDQGVDLRVSWLLRPLTATRSSLALGAGSENHIDVSQIGLVGGLIGGAIGVVGGAIGTYFGIKNTAGPRERAFMVRVSAVAWIIISAFIAGLLLLPQPYNWLLWVPYGIGLPVAIVWLNRRQTRIRSEESKTSSAMPPER